MLRVGGEPAHSHSLTLATSHSTPLLPPVRHGAVTYRAQMECLPSAPVGGCPLVTATTARAQVSGSEIAVSIQVC